MRGELDLDGTPYLQYIVSSGVKLVQIEALHERLGGLRDRVEGVFFIGRPLNDAATAKLAEWPLLGQMKRIGFNSTKLSKDFLKILGEGAQVEALTHFTKAAPSSTELTAITRGPSYSNLRALELEGKGNADKWVSRIEKSKVLTQVDSLYTYDWSGDWISALAGEFGQRLRRLGLGGLTTADHVGEALQMATNLKLLHVRNQIWAASMMQHWPDPPNLRVLSADMVTLDDEAWDSLDAWGVLPQLEYLALPGAGTATTIRRLTRHDDLQIRKLTMEGHSVTANDLLALAQWSHWPKLEQLVFRGGDAAALAPFVEATDFSGLDWFVFQVNTRFADAEDVEALRAALASNDTLSGLAHDPALQFVSH